MRLFYAVAVPRRRVAHGTHPITHPHPSYPHQQQCQRWPTTDPRLRTTLLFPWDAATALLEQPHLPNNPKRQRGFALHALDERLAVPDPGRDVAAWCRQQQPRTPSDVKPAPMPAAERAAAPWELNTCRGARAGGRAACRVPRAHGWLTRPAWHAGPGRDARRRTHAVDASGMAARQPNVRGVAHAYGALAQPLRTRLSHCALPRVRVNRQLCQYGWLVEQGPHGRCCVPRVVHEQLHGVRRPQPGHFDDGIYQALTCRAQPVGGCHAARVDASRVCRARPVVAVLAPVVAIDVTVVPVV